MEYLNNLNEKQREAAMYTEGPLLILAGAGSGKTSTMTRRIAYMILEKGISPYEILAVTFTNKAAREMKERVESLIGTGTNMWIMTFHSACLRILRMNADRIGYTRDFTIYDPVDQRAVAKALIKAENLDDKEFSPNYVLSIISSAKEKGVDSREFAETADGYKEKIVAKLYRGYEETLKKNNAMDFDDLIWRTVHLFETDEEVLEYYRQKFHYIMVDEYQDTNFNAVDHVASSDCWRNSTGISAWWGMTISASISGEAPISAIFSPLKRIFRARRWSSWNKNYRSCANILKAAHSVIPE